MTKKSKSTDGPVKAAKPPEDKGGARKRLRRLEQKLADLRATEAKHVAQLKEVRAKLADARTRLIALRGEVAVASQATGSGGTPAGPIGYCMREKRSVEISDPEPVTLSNGRSAVAGTCSACGARVVALSARAASSSA